MKLRKQKIAERILARDNAACVYCGAALTLATIRLDHVHSKSTGGSNKDDNLAASCARCNGIKGYKDLTHLYDKAVSRAAEALANHRYYSSVAKRVQELL